MAIDLARFMTAGLPPKAIIEKLFDIPEVAQAFHLRERSRLGLDIDTPEGQALMAERIKQVADFLDDGLPRCAPRSVYGELMACSEWTVRILPASADTLPQGGDAKQARCASKGSAVDAKGSETP